MPVQVQVTVRRRTRDKAIDGKPHEANYRINITHQYTRVGPGDFFLYSDCYIQLRFKHNVILLPEPAGSVHFLDYSIQYNRKQ